MYLVRQLELNFTTTPGRKLRYSMSVITDIVHIAEQGSKSVCYGAVL